MSQRVTALFLWFHPLTSHPFAYFLSRQLLECKTEGAVAAITTLLSQFKGSKGTLIRYGLAIEMAEMSDAQPIDISIIGLTLVGEIRTQIGAVGAYSNSQLGQRQVVQQIEFGMLAMFPQQRIHQVFCLVNEGIIIRLLYLGVGAGWKFAAKR